MNNWNRGKPNSSIWWNEECERFITAKRYAYLNAEAFLEYKRVAINMRSGLEK
jgi:hypothetical protein